MGCGERFEGPEAGRQLHQGDGRQCSIGVRGHENLHRVSSVIVIGSNFDLLRLRVILAE